MADMRASDSRMTDMRAAAACRVANVRVVDCQANPHGVVTLLRDALIICRAGWVHGQAVGQQHLVQPAISQAGSQAGSQSASQ